MRKIFLIFCLLILSNVSVVHSQDSRILNYYTVPINLRPCYVRWAIEQMHYPREVGDYFLTIINTNSYQVVSVQNSTRFYAIVDHRGANYNCTARLPHGQIQGKLYKVKYRQSNILHVASLIIVGENQLYLRPLDASTRVESIQTEQVYFQPTKQQTIPLQTTSLKKEFGFSHQASVGYGHSASNLKKKNSLFGFYGLNIGQEYSNSQMFSPHYNVELGVTLQKSFHEKLRPSPSGRKSWTNSYYDFSFSLNRKNKWKMHEGIMNHKWEIGTYIGQLSNYQETVPIGGFFLSDDFSLTPKLGLQFNLDHYNALKKSINDHNFTSILLGIDLKLLPDINTKLGGQIIADGKSDFFRTYTRIGFKKFSLKLYMDNLTSKPTIGTKRSDHRVFGTTVSFDLDEIFDHKIF